MGNEKIITKHSENGKTISKEVHKKDNEILVNNEMISDIGGKFKFKFYLILTEYFLQIILIIWKQFPKVIRWNLKKMMNQNQISHEVI